jgi:homoserine/homoserine lactone efflux protein
MSLELYLAYIATCIVIVIVPGPTVTLIVANSLAHGTRAGLLNVAGTQLGLALMIAVVVVGLASIIATIGVWFDWMRLAGAAYLVFIGVKLFRSAGTLIPAQKVPAPRGGFFLQGFLVIMSNPKALLVFGAFIPQFVDPNGDYVAQVIGLGVTFMTIGALFDGAYAVLTGRARQLMSERRMRAVTRVSGLFLIGGGVWLALARTR